ncbi:hypothetical protein QR680_011686 [Steinernema hermaphroditum]|uniref:SH2 domain-containing protein n=1 Tax=Steinernema hermaphroditum TaxID=289476 RepID=A0AA39I1V4_9BILA|nr:hypothetical protein QR680_011686 [Steinernema hermaphroditum]
MRLPLGRGDGETEASSLGAPAKGRAVEFLCGAMTPPTFSPHNHPTLVIPTELCASEVDRWTHFCEQYARSVAYNFESSWSGFVAVNLTKRPPPIDNVIERFCRVFAAELADRFATTTTNSPRTTTPFISAAAEETTPMPTLRRRPTPTRNLRKTLVSMFNLDRRPNVKVWRSTESARERPSSMYGATSLFRCKSEMSNYFNAISPDQTSVSSSACSTHTKRASWFRSKFGSKKTVELVKEGHVRYLQGLDLDTKSWQKGRLCLVKTSGGYLLEFYPPSKSSRAKSGIFCLLIAEVRETSDLEDWTDCTFVLKAFNGMEYVIETKSREECLQWINAIRDSIPLGNPPLIIDPNRPGGSRLCRKPSLPSSSNLIKRNHLGFSSRSLNNVQSLVTTARLSDEHRVPVWLNRFPPGLDNYPWFHARLSRNESSSLVLHNGVDGHGLFLVRQSETRPGEFVLTFNLSNKAKHLRISIENTGECSLQGLTFSSMVDLLEYFREHPLPAESSSCATVYLKEYVICWKRAGRHAEIDPTLGDYLTHKGSVRIDIQSLQNVIRAQRSRTNNNYNFI